MKDTSNLTADNLYSDDILDIQFTCGCYARAHTFGANQFGGDEILLGYGLCEPHETMYGRYTLNAIIARGVLHIASINIGRGEGNSYAVQEQEAGEIPSGAPGEDRRLEHLPGMGARDESEEAPGESTEGRE